MIMITPASANQIPTSMATHELKNHNICGNKVIPNLKILNSKKQNSKNTLKKVLAPLKSSQRIHSTSTNYSQLIACASKLQPIMEESYKNTNNILKSLNKDQKTLETQKIKIQDKWKKLNPRYTTTN
ncbi:MAG: hypothetical protein NKF70_12340 [Methanobacterium sp. ERen5]|nr:MAG: hypothetical protein NKF70_12340 [Methanobacterium sp. ERen5]